MVNICEDRDFWLAPICARFGVPEAFFDDFVLIRANTKMLNMVNVDHVPPTHPEPASIGMPFLHIKMAVPKLTSAAAMWLGPHASAAQIPLNAEEATAFLRRETITLSDVMMCREIGRGYVMARQGEDVLGLGFLGGLDTQPVLESFVPRAWSVGVPA